MLRREAVPELMQKDCNPERLAAEIERLWADPALPAAQAAAGREVLLQLGLGELRPSRRAAEVVLDIIARRQPAPSLTAA
jgi:lipid-A-disaccharide synthase